MSKQKIMLVFHSAYPFFDIKERGLEIFVTARDAAQYFDSVLTVNPLASLQYPAEEIVRAGPPRLFVLDARNMILEAHLNRFKVLNNLPALNFIASQFSLVASLIFRKRLRDIALVRSEDPRFNGMYGYLFSRLLRKPFVVGVWGNPSRIREETGAVLMPRLFKSARQEEAVERFVLRRADMVLAQNEENLAYALAFGVAREKTAILPLGVGIDAAHFLEKNERANFKGEFRNLGLTAKYLIFCVSRLEALKRVDYAIRACVGLKESSIDFQLVLVGDGRERDALVGLTQELGLGDRVVFVGNRGQDWLASALTHASLALAPLTGRALLEIALAGCPVVAFDIDWHSEIVRNNETGTLVRDLDFKAMGDAAKLILESETTRIQFGNNIRQLALEIADPERLAAKQAAIYRALVEPQ